jgi:hypothetical protein
MPLKKLEKPGLVYIAYCRKGFEDFEEFKVVLETLAKENDQQRSVTVDLTKSSGITDGEIGVLAKLIKGFQGTKRYLMIVATETIKAKIEATNLFKTGNVELYDNHLALFEGMSRNQQVAGAEKKHAEGKG